MNIPKKLLLSNLLNHSVRCDQGIDHGKGVYAWMHPPVHRILGWVSRPSNFTLQREVWRLDQLKGINQHEVYVKGNYSPSDEQTINRFPTLMNSNVFNKTGQKIGLIADFVFETKTGKIDYYLVSRSNPKIPGTSRWRLLISQIKDKQPGSISCDIESFEDLPIYRASIKEEFFSKSRKWKNQFQDLTYKASDRLEGWIDEQINDDEKTNIDDPYSENNNSDLYDDWIDSFEEMPRMDGVKTDRNRTNENDLDPWI